MTLLEALLATVILSVVAVACLEGTHRAAALQYRAGVTAHTVAVAQAAMAQAAANAPVDDRAVRVTHSRYVQDGRPAALDRITVEVSLESGGTFRLARLVPRAPDALR